MPPGFKREELRARYNVPEFEEDAWHAFSGARTKEILAGLLPKLECSTGRLLNAGAGVYKVCGAPWDEFSIDLFAVPILRRPRAVCGSVEHLPFQNGAFEIVVCVGEVLAYCDPAAAIREFARVLAPSATLICDFGSSRSIRYWFRAPFGRAADLVTDHYNGTPEPTWVYDPAYIKSVLAHFGFNIKFEIGTHTWSALARKAGLPITVALFLQQRLVAVNQ
ncbi:MAG: methyltransferase domain-containing protein [Limisphaerales bacterium]